MENYCEQKSLCINSGRASALQWRMANEKVGRIEGESREQSVVQIYGSVSFQNRGHNGPVFISLSAARYHKHPSLRVDGCTAVRPN